MPFLQKCSAVFDDEDAYAVEFVTSESLGFSQFDRIQPIFCQFVAVFDMNMGWFRSLAAEKEEPESK